MTVDPQLAGLLELVNSAPPMNEGSPAEARAALAQLRAAGNEVVLRRFDGMIHGFFDMGAFSPGAQKAVDETCTLFAELLHP